VQETTPAQDVATENVVTENWVRPIVIVAVGMFMGLLDVTIVNVAVPAIQKDFGGSLDDVLWIATAYTLVLGVVVPLTGWLGDRMGLTKLYVAAVVVFAACSGLCGIAWNLGFLILARILQAVPGGILPVVCVGIVYRIVPKHKISSAMGVVSLGFVVAPAVGPVVGGYLVEHLDWRLVFFINLPLGVVTAIVAWLMVPKVPPTTAVTRFDMAGFATAAAGLSTILLAASKGEDWGWSSYPVLILLAFGVLSLALFIVIELEVDDPLLDLRLFRIGYFTLGVFMMGMLTANLLASSFYLPVFLQQGQHLQAFEAGMRVFPQALGMTVATGLASQLYERVGPRILCAAGCAVSTVGNLLLCDITPDMTSTEIVVWTTVRGFGMSLCAVPALTAGVNCVRPSSTNQASAWQNLSQQVVGAFALAVLGTLITSQSAQLTADRAALLGPDSQLAQAAAPALAQTSSPSAETFSMVYRAASGLQVDVMAGALRDMFLVLAFTTLLGAVLSLLFPMKQEPVEESFEDGTGPAVAGSEPAEAMAGGRHRADRIPESRGVPDVEQVPEAALRH
jgi:EmrB/QacA subfamily drug resistance transporter